MNDLPLVSFAPWQQPKKLDILTFERLFKMRFCRHLFFADYCVEQYLKKKCHKAYYKQKIPDYTIWLGHLHKTTLKEGKIPDVTISWIDAKVGYGLLTNQPLEEWQCIGEYAGQLRFRNHFFPNINDYCFMYPHEWINFKPLTIDCGYYGNHTRFINHSDSPNLEALSIFYEGIYHIIFRAIRKIKAGEELTYDYGEIYWNRRKKFSR